MKRPHLWIVGLILLVAIGVAYFLFSRSPAVIEDVTPSAQESVDTEQEPVEPVPEAPVTLTEKAPRHVAIVGNTVRIEKEGLEFDIPDGFNVSGIYGSDDKTPVIVTVVLEKGGKEIRVFVNYPAEFYGDIDDIALDIDREPKTAWRRESITHTTAGPYDVMWGNVRTVEDTSQYLAVLFRGYASGDAPVLETLIDSLRYIN